MDRSSECDHIYGLIKDKNECRFIRRSLLTQLQTTDFERAVRFSFCPNCGIGISWLLGVLTFDDQTPETRWDRSTEELLAALSRHGSVAGAAKALKTTSVTLSKALQRHQIVQKWTVEKDASA